MSDKKNIERLFQEKFKDFESVPSPIVWDKIEAELQKKKKRRVIPLWFRLSGVAAILLIGFLIGDGIISNPSINTGVVNQEENTPNSKGGKELTPMQRPIRSNEVVTEIDYVKENNSEKNGLPENDSRIINSETNNSKENSVASQETANGKNNTLKNKQEKSNIDKNFKIRKSENNAGIASSSENGKNNTQSGKTTDSNKTATNSDNSKVQNSKNNSGIASSSESEKNAQDAKISNNTDKNLKNSKNNTGIAGTATSEENKNNKIEKKFTDNTTSKNNALVNQENPNEKQINLFEESRKNNSQKKDGISQNKSLIDQNPNQNNTSQIAFDSKAFEKQKKDSTAVATVVPNPLEELLLQQEKEKQAVTETKVNRWQITSNVAPIYFSSASNGSPIDSKFADNSKNYEKNMSYGVGVNYALNKKWSVRGGVNKLTLGYNTNDIVYYAGLSDSRTLAMAPSNVQEKRGVVMIVEDNTAANLISFDDVPGKKAGSLNQTMGYVEVPMELSYKILDRKFGIEVIGGMSTLFLNENNLSVVSPGMSTSIGKATNLNDVSFTSNFGIGFKYKFWKSFQANVEPKLKYQINTFSENAGGFKPYFIGIYSGISFNF